jgi:hypothetical protein
LPSIWQTTNPDAAASAPITSRGKARVHDSSALAASNARIAWKYVAR